MKDLDTGILNIRQSIVRMNRYLVSICKGYLKSTLSFPNVVDLINRVGDLILRSIDYPLNPAECDSPHQKYRKIDLCILSVKEGIDADAHNIIYF